MSENKQIGVYCIGEMVIDFLPGSEPGVYIRKAGGAPANVAIALARQGCRSAFCGMLGADDFGRFLQKTLEDNGVFVLNRELTEKAVTTMAFVTLGEDGERSFTFARKPGADMFLTRAHVRAEDLEMTTVVHAGSCSLSKGTVANATRYALKEGQRLGKLVSFDVNYRALLWDNDQNAAIRAIRDVLPLVDLLKLSEEEACMLGGEDTLEAIMEDNDITVIIETLGRAGARCLWNGKELRVPGTGTPCVDATGAGDAFWGGFLATLLKAGLRCPADLSEELLLEAMDSGNFAGALCVLKKGAIESLPTAQEMEIFRRELGL